MEKLGAVGNSMIRPSGMMRALQMLFKGNGNQPLSVSSQKPSYSGSTGSFKQNQRRERKASWKKKCKRFGKG